MKRQLLIFPIILGLVLISCGEKNDSTQTPPADTLYPLGSGQSRDTGYNPANEELFEELVYKEYAYLATRMPTRQVDSLMKATIEKIKDPSKMEGELQKAMTPLKNRYDSLARQTIAGKYNISLDSVQAIIAEVNGRRKAGGEKNGGK